MAPSCLYTGPVEGRIKLGLGERGHLSVVKKLRGPSVCVCRGWWQVGRTGSLEMGRMGMGCLTRGASWWMESGGLWPGPQCLVSESSFPLASCQIPWCDNFLLVLSIPILFFLAIEMHFFYFNSIMILSIKIYRLLKLLFCVFLTTQCSIVYFVLIKTLVQGVPFNDFFSPTCWAFGCVR